MQFVSSLFHRSLIVQYKGECACVGEVGKKKNAMRQCARSRRFFFFFFLSFCPTFSLSTDEETVSVANECVFWVQFIPPIATIVDALCIGYFFSLGLMSTCPLWAKGENESKARRKRGPYVSDCTCGHTYLISRKEKERNERRRRRIFFTVKLRLTCSRCSTIILFSIHQSTCLTRRRNACVKISMIINLPREKMHAFVRSF